MMKNGTTILWVTALLLASLAGCGSDAHNPAKEYCEMWGIWHQSGGEYGWPDPDNKHTSRCEQ